MPPSREVRLPAALKRRATPWMHLPAALTASA
jgi:hypothetical protein